MARKKLFEYAVLWHPTEKQEKDGEVSKVIVEKTTVLETNEQSLGLKAAMSIPAEYRECLEQIEIAIRPF
jgi:hypothetical protein